MSNTRKKTVALSAEKIYQIFSRRLAELEKEQKKIMVDFQQALDKVKIAKIKDELAKKK